VGNELAQRNVAPGIVRFLDLTTSLWKNGIKVFEQIEDLNSALEKYNETTLERLAGFITTSSEGIQGINELEEILKLTKNTAAFGHMYLTPQLARGLSYYTGAIVEIELLDDNFKGSLGGGGRYDSLIGMFGKEEIPACGFSLGLERIIFVMTERNMFPADLQNAAADVLVTIWNEDSVGESLKLANELREQGLRVFVYPEAEKLGKQFKYASQINAPFVCVLSETELAENKVTLKNMKTGEQQIIERKEVFGKIKL
jgi:histidyl-tRNA synthetase